MPYSFFSSFRGRKCSVGFLLLFTFLFSCTTVRHPERAPLEKSLLWEIKGPGIRTPSYLFGTIHLIDAESYFIPAGTMTAFERSEKVIFEIDMKEMSDLSAMMGIMGKVFMKDNMTLKDLLSEEDYELVRRHFQKAGLPLFMLERMKPMFLTIFAGDDVDPSGLQSGKMKSYEMEILNWANSSKKQTGGLETIDFQVSLFDEIPYEAQAKMLVNSIRQSSSGTDSSLDQMTQMYTSQDIDAMAASIGESSDGFADLEDKLVLKRNQSWIQPMVESAKKQPTFFAVGAGHLGGKMGLIRLLRSAGYTVRPAQFQ